jgi:sugar lactone lactonase YvrE
MTTPLKQNHENEVLASGFGMGESTRWHLGRLWFSDWGTQEILAVDLQGRVECIAKLPFGLPFCFDLLPPGELLIVAGREGRLVRRASDGSLTTYADLSHIAATIWNEIVIDGRGNAYVNSAEAVALVTPGGAARKVADGGAFPNGMAITPDNRTLVMAESHGRRLTAFDIADDGSLSNRRIWAELDGVPDGICADAEGAIWYADVPNRRCLRVREGGDVLDRIEIDRGAFACMLGGLDGQTLFIAANEWRGMEKVAEVVEARTGQVIAVPVCVTGAGWPGGNEILTR